MGLLLFFAALGWVLDTLQTMPYGGTIFWLAVAFLAVELAAELVLVGWDVMPIHGILKLLGLPLQLRRRWRAVPLHERNIIRATVAVFVLVFCGWLAAKGFPFVGPKITGAIAASAGLYLIVGISGSRGARVDWMSLFWMAAAAVGCAAFLIMKGMPL